MTSRFEMLYEQAWRREHFSGGAVASAPAVESAFPRHAPLETFRKWEEVVRQQLGPKVAGLAPSMEKARTLVMALFPPDRASEVQGADRSAKRQELKALLNQIEDLLQALQLASGVR